MRALLSAEILHNQGVLYSQVTQLGYLLGEAGRRGTEDKVYLVASLRDTYKLPVWETARWSIPEVGVSLAPTEMMHLAEWYSKLTYVSLLLDSFYRRLVTEDSMTSEDMSAFEGEKRLEAARLVADLRALNAESHLSQAEIVYEFVKGVMDNPPPFPDKRFATDTGLQEYEVALRELSRAEPWAQPPGSVSGSAASSAESPSEIPS